MTDWERILEPYERCIGVRILGKPFEVPENNLLLRGFQYLEPERVPQGDFCWNGECRNCACTLRRGGIEREVLACETVAEEGDELTALSPQVRQILAALLRK